MRWSRNGKDLKILRGTEVLLHPFPANTFVRLTVNFTNTRWTYDYALHSDRQIVTLPL